MFLKNDFLLLVTFSFSFSSIKMKFCPRLSSSFFEDQFLSLCEFPAFVVCRSSNELLRLILRALSSWKYFLRVSDWFASLLLGFSFSFGLDSLSLIFQGGSDPGSWSEGDEFISGEANVALFWSSRNTLSKTREFFRCFLALLRPKFNSKSCSE